MTPQTDFERFALNHDQHVHCNGCGGCLLDPSHLVQGFRGWTWCVGCRDRIKVNCARTGVPVPWKGGVEFV